MINTSEEFISWLQDNEKNLMERILVYAKKYNAPKNQDNLVA